MICKHQPKVHTTGFKPLTARATATGRMVAGQFYHQDHQQNQIKGKSLQLSLPTIRGSTVTQSLPVAQQLSRAIKLMDHTAPKRIKAQEKHRQITRLMEQNQRRRRWWQRMQKWAREFKITRLSDRRTLLIHC